MTRRRDEGFPVPLRDGAGAGADQLRAYLGSASPASEQVAWTRLMEAMATREARRGNRLWAVAALGMLAGAGAAAVFFLRADVERIVEAPDDVAAADHATAREAIAPGTAIAFDEPAGDQATSRTTPSGVGTVDRGAAASAPAASGEAPRRGGGERPRLSLSHKPVAIPAGASTIESVARATLSADGVALARTDAGDVEVQLLTGRIELQMGRPVPGRRFAVSAGAYRFIDIGTTFAVEARGADVSLEVTSGLVAVYESGRELARIGAGRRWSSQEVARPAATAVGQTPAAASESADTQAEAHLAQGERYRAERDCARAEPEYAAAMAIAISPRIADPAWYYRAVCLEDLGRLIEAQAVYRAYLFRAEGPLVREARARLDALEHSRRAP